MGIGEMGELGDMGMHINMNMGMVMNNMNNMNSMNFGEIGAVEARGPNASGNSNSNSNSNGAVQEAAARRRRDVRTARDKLGEQFEELKGVLPRRDAGGELTAKSQILEHSLGVLRQLMTRATTLAVELAVVSPEATHRWVQDVSDDGRRPIEHTVAAVMKLFCWSRRWQYAEWWTLDETSNVDVGGGNGNGNGNGSMDGDTNSNGNTNGNGGERRTGDEARNANNTDIDIDINIGATREEETSSHTNVNMNHSAASPDNVQACVIRDCVSVMKLTRTLINVKTCTRDVTAFARMSKDFQFRPRYGMPGRVWTSRRAEWLPTLGDADSYRRSSLAHKFGMKTCLAVPVVLGGQVHSVMAFYAQTSLPFNSKCHDLATTLSQSLANIYSPHPSDGWDVSFQRML